MLALGKSFFDLFQIPYKLLEYGRGWLFDGGDYAGIVFLILTVLMGGTMAYASGRAIALTWRPIWQAIAYMLPLCAMVRFLHFALYEESLLATVLFMTTFLILALCAAWGYQTTRVGQMLRQYPFAFKRAGRFGWQNSA